MLTGNSVGDNATFTCQEEFELIGQELATCVMMVDGNGAMFMPDSPLCRRKLNAADSTSTFMFIIIASPMAHVYILV